MRIIEEKSMVIASQSEALYSLQVSVSEEYFAWAFQNTNSFLNIMLWPLQASLFVILFFVFDFLAKLVQTMSKYEMWATARVFLTCTDYDSSEAKEEEEETYGEETWKAEVLANCRTS